MKALKKPILLATLLLLASFLLAACGEETTPTTGDSEQQAVAVSVVLAGNQDIETKTMIKGSIAAQTEVAVMPKSAGVVEKVNVAVGDTVKKDQTLFTLETKELRAQLEQAQASYRMNKAAYDDAVRTYERMQTLYDEGAISLSQLEQAEVAVDRSSTDSAAASVELLQLQLNNATIKAPIAGIVSAVTVTEGQIAGQQVAAVTIVDIDKVKLAADITEANINQVAVGQEVQVNVSAASSEPFTGVIDTIAPAVDSRTMAYPVTILIDNPEHQLKAGMFAEANISTEKREQVLAVPVSALVTGEEPAVYVVQDGVAHLAPIETGLTNEEWAEVLSGLEPGAQVVVQGQHRLVEGTPVTVVTGE